MKEKWQSFWQKCEHLLELGGTVKDVVLLVLSGISVLLSFIFSETGVQLPFDVAIISVVLCGIPIICEAIIGLMSKFDIKADVLVSMAIIASICIGEYFAAGEVAFIMQLGGLLEDLTVAKARAGIEKLVHLTPVSARVVTADGEQIVAADKVCVGDLLRVLPGETIAVDGVIESGTTSINQAVMTGESIPVDKTVGDEVSSGTINLYGTFDMRATKVGEDSSIQRMIRLVQSADASKAKIVSLADRWATWIVVIALVAAGITWGVSKEIIRAVTILVVFCPCALVLATPTAIMAAIGNVTKHGFLVKEGDALERLAKVKRIAFDKTGTITYGTPEVILSKSVCDETDDEILAVAACAEQRSEHPLGKAICKSYGKTPYPTDDFKMYLGSGVEAKHGERTYLVGNASLIAQNSIEIPDSVRREVEDKSKGCTAIYVAKDDVLIGYLILSDTIRADVKNTISQLDALGVKSVLLTGDNQNAATAMAEQAGISDVKAECLPEDKLNAIDAYEAQKQPVCMIGDGINDAPALKKATVGIAMGGAGSDIAVDSADIALINDDVKELPHLFALSKRMMTTIKLNLTFSMGLNFLSIGLAIGGVIDPVVGALVHNAGSVLVIINSALLLKWKSKKLEKTARK